MHNILGTNLQTPSVPVLIYCRAALVGFCLPDQRRAYSNQPALLRKLESARSGMELTLTRPGLGAEQQDHSSQSCRLISAVLRTRANQLSKTERLFLPLFLHAQFQAMILASYMDRGHPLFPTGQARATAAKFTISRLFCLQSVKNFQEHPPSSVLFSTLSVRRAEWVAAEQGTTHRDSRQVLPATRSEATA